MNISGVSNSDKPGDPVREGCPLCRIPGCSQGSGNVSRSRAVGLPAHSASAAS